MMCTAKAITNGYFPFGAVMINGKLAEAFESDKTGKAAIGSGYTYSGHPVGAAAAIACLQETEKLKVNENAAERGMELYQGLLDLKEKHSLIGDVRGGHGLMCAMELVSDRETKAPADKETISNLYAETYKRGSMIRISGPNAILSPPLVISTQEISSMLNAMDDAFAAIA